MREARQVEVGDQLAQFLPRHEVAGAELSELALVEEGQARRKEFAEDDALAQALRDAEADALRKLGQRLVDALLVARLDPLDAVAHHDPVDLAAFLDRSGLARLEDQLGVEGEAADLESLGLDLPDEVEIDEAVVHRRDQRVGSLRRVAGERVVAAGRVEDDEVGRAGEIARRNLGDLRFERVDRFSVEHRKVHARQLDIAPRAGLGAVFEIARERALAVVEVDRRHPRPAIGQRDRDVHRGRRLAGAALLVGEDDPVRAWAVWDGLAHVCFGFLWCDRACSGRRQVLRFYPRGVPVQTVDRLSSLREAVDSLRPRGPLALVPTMGALHEGHLTLVREAKAHAASVVVSIFVNPTQFGPNEDLDAYPRQLAEDSAMLEAEGVDLLWAPPVSEVYPDGFATTVSVAGVSEGLCGASRPGHFDGVATVVCKLFNQVRPDLAVFGEKDWQQLAVIRLMARDLDLTQPRAEAIHGVVTVREADGLALSSRNRYLSPENRTRAAILPRAMREAIGDIENGTSVGDALSALKAALTGGGFDSVDYAELADADSLRPLARLADRPARLLVAARIGGTRLIDNMAVEPQKG